MGPDAGGTGKGGAVAGEGGGKTEGGRCQATGDGEPASGRGTECPPGIPQQGRLHERPDGCLLHAVQHHHSLGGTAVGNSVDSVEKSPSEIIRKYASSILWQIERISRSVLLYSALGVHVSEI